MEDLAAPLQRIGDIQSKIVARFPWDHANNCTFCRTSLGTVPNFDAGWGERSLKFAAKNPSRKTNKMCSDTFYDRLGERMHERNI